MMAEGDPAPRGGDNKFSADYVAGLQAQIDRLKDEARTAVTAHREALAEAKRAGDEAVAALRTEHKTALDGATAAHAEALGKAQREGTEALTAAQAAALKRIVGFALRAEGSAAGLLDHDQLRLLDEAEIAKLTVDDAGAVAGAKPLIEAMKKAKPFLFGQGSTSNPNPPPNQQPPVQKHARDMTDAEFEEANRRKAWRTAA
jgi:hypothetical protein